MIALFLALIAQSSPTQTAPPQPAVSPEAVEVAPATVTAPKPKDRVVCRMETATGSSIAKRVCMTQTQIAQRKKAAQENIQKLLDLRTTGRQPINAE